MIPAFSKPKDILEKVIREARELNFENDEILVPDRVFNFSVTCHFLRGWCIKERNITDTNGAHEEWNKEIALKIA